MAVFKGDASVLRTEAGGTRRFSLRTEDAAGAPANRTTWQVLAGSSITLFYRTETTGITPPGVPALVQLFVYYETGTGLLIRELHNGAPPADGTSYTFWGTVDGLEGSAPRAGTVRLFVRADRDAVVAYDVSSDADGDQGAVQVKMADPSHAVSAYPAGATFAYPDPITITVTHTPKYADRNVETVRIDVLDGAAQQVAGSNQETGAGGAGITPQAFTANNTFDVAAKTYGSRIVIIGASALLATEKWTTIGAAAATQHDRAAYYDADPRITFSDLLQLNDNVFATPPGGEDVASGQRLASDLGFLAARAVNARSEGLNSLAWTEKLWDDGELVGSEASPVATRATVSATQGGQAGWSDDFLTWDESLPGGAWTQKQVITTSGATGLEVGNTRALALLAADPRVALFVGGGDPTNPKDHFQPGRQLTIAIALTESMNGKSQAIVADVGTVRFLLSRLNPATGRKQRFDTTDTDTDHPAGTWKDWTGTDQADLVEAEVSPGDPTLYLHTFTASETTEAAGWDYKDLVVDAFGDIGGVSYHGQGLITVMGKKNPHAKNEFDPTGLFQ